MTLNEFKNWALSQGSVCKHPSSGGGICGECVSLVNQYCWQVVNVPAQAWGHAYAWAQDSNPNRAYFDKVPSIQAGDVIVYGTDFTPLYGHIGVALGDGQILDQNGRIPRKVAVGAIYNGYNAILRRKGSGGNMAKFTAEQEKVAALMATGSIPGPNYNYPFTVKEINSDTLNDLLNTWNSRSTIVTAEMEQTLAKMATGSPYGAAYNSPYQGKPVLSVLTPMLNFWLGQRSNSVPATKLNPGLYKVE